MGFFKWAGGKTKLLPYIIPYIPDDMENYIEPFIGGGSVLMHIASSYPKIQAYISDINPVIAAVYRVIQQDADDLLLDLVAIQQLYNYSPQEVRQNIYQKIRDEFNVLKDNFQNDYYATNLVVKRFLLLNRMCFNGLYRENSRGKFNVAHGDYKTVTYFTKEQINRLNYLLRNVHIYNRPFEEMIEFVQPKSFIYLDPPYLPVSDTANFTRYHKIDFTKNDHLRLYEFIKQTETIGAKFLLSSSDNDFIKELYSEFHIETIQANRNINSDITKRNKVTELLISNISK